MIYDLPTANFFSPTKAAKLRKGIVIASFYCLSCFAVLSVLVGFSLLSLTF